ncbi:hypothetical protein [Thetidibacter halocola]|uniref:Uncharacterized protein n=1 Tax=Thetidibacter halocola TaxID=2827239 RepID=A0A8J8B9C4_9RHOB|nr:hypothetical protein [Thetidibacter halocola]MBS0126332.1 hypothetical protein [Thetidibacter halocola]
MPHTEAARLSAYAAQTPLDRLRALERSGAVTLVDRDGPADSALAGGMGAQLQALSDRISDLEEALERATAAGRDEPRQTLATIAECRVQMAALCRLLLSE